MDDQIINNKVYLQGIAEDDPVFNHTVMDENFFNFHLKILRLSGQFDIVPITISEKMLKVQPIKAGDKVALRGQFRSFNKLEEERRKLILSVFVRELCEWDSEDNSNVIEMNGYICKPAIYRTTPFAREICDMLLAVNRNYNKSDYIPCIAWGRNAQFVNSLPVGTELTIVGRIQSREYSKHIEGQDEPLIKTAYEVSISKLMPSDARNIN
ncbi:MAG: single-stranded DNA-binding protein [Clostridiales bacterium]|nr:single-stranded DNA-binding protein [Clostridiales bacterium]